MKKHLQLFALCMAAMLVLTACPQPEPEPEPQPVPKPDVTVSLGQTTKVTLESMLSEPEKAGLEAASDAYYVKGTGDPVTLSFDILEGFDPAKPFSRYVKYPITSSFNVGKKPTIPASAPEEIDLSTVLPATVKLADKSKSMTIYFPSLPNSLVSVENLEMTENSRFELTLSFVSPFFTEGTITPSFTVDMRKFFGSPEAVDGFLQFDAPLTKENDYKATKSFRLNSVAFDPENYDAKQHTLKMDAGISLSGTVALDGLKTTKTRLAAAPSTFQIEATVVMYDLACKSITGTFTYQVASVSKSFSIANVPSSVVMNPDMTSLDLDLSSNLTMPFVATANLTAKKDRRQYAEVKDIRFDIPVANPGETATGKCDLVKTADLSGFMSQCPDEVAFSIGAVSKENMSGVAAVGDTAFASFKPSIRFPLVFNDQFSYTITQNLSVQSSVGTALKQKAVVLGGSVTNTLPMDVEMTVVLTGDNGMALSDAVKQTISADSSTQLNLTINKVIAGAEGITQAKVTYKVTGRSGSRPVKPTDGLQADLSITIPGDK